MRKLFSIIALFLVSSISVSADLTCTNCTINATTTVFDTGATGVGFGFILFILALTMFLFLLPVIVQNFSAVEWLDNLFKRSCILLGFASLVWSTAVIAELLKYSMPGMEQHATGLFAFYSFASLALLAWFLLGMIIDTINFLKKQQEQKRMGGPEE